MTLAPKTPTQRRHCGNMFCRPFPVAIFRRQRLVAVDVRHCGDPYCAGREDPQSLDDWQTPAAVTAHAGGDIA